MDEAIEKLKRSEKKPIDIKKKKKAKKEDPRGEPDVIVKVKVTGQGELPIHIYDGDRAEDLARSFCIDNVITDQNKQDKLIKVLTNKINERKAK